MNEFIIQWYSRSIFNFQPSEITHLFRKIETKSKQLITNNLHQEFNNICLNENLLPICTNINIYIYIYIYTTSVPTTSSPYYGGTPWWINCFNIYTVCFNHAKQNFDKKTR